jgi:hypothetical protein
VPSGVDCSKIEQFSVARHSALLKVRPSVIQVLPPTNQAAADVWRARDEYKSKKHNSFE